MSVHLQITSGVTACGLSRANGGSFALTSTVHKAAVTCPDCKATTVFAQAKQRIPLIPVPVYRHV